MKSRNLFQELPAKGQNAISCVLNTKCLTSAERDGGKRKEKHSQRETKGKQR